MPLRQHPHRHHRLWLVAAIAGCAASAAAAADGPVEKVTVRAVANFEFAKATLRPDDEAEILADVGRMQGVTWQTITATGHTDSVGSAVANRRLSAARASAVKAYLVGKGIDASMIHTAAKASQAPVAPNTTDSGRAKNRRTEIEFQGVKATQ